MKIIRYASCALVLVLAGCATLTETANIRAEADVSPADLQLRLDVLDRLADDAVTGQHSFGVTSVDGVVTLFGVVPDQAVRLRARHVAAGTPGVVHVDDQLRR